MIFLDIETDTKHQQIWVCVTKKGEDFSVWTSPDGLQEYLNDHKVVAHNGIGFDFPLLAKHWGVKILPHNMVDTLLMSRLYNPELERAEGNPKASPHSLEAWGHRLGDYKQDFSDYDGGLTDEMLEYCKQDVNVLEKLYHKLVELLEKEKFSQQSIELEHAVGLVCKEMEDNGYKLDVQKAQAFLATVSGEMSDIESQLQVVFPEIVEERYSAKTGKRLKDKVTVFNPNSRDHVADRLINLGVKFTKKTETGKWKIDESVLSKIDLPEAQMINRYTMLQKRLSQVESWLELVDDGGRVHGRIATNGAISGRASHFSPNMAQIPAVDKPYGSECREMWCVEKGYKQVGVDLSGIELRCLGHYLRDEDWIEELIKGDIHWLNAQNFGLVPRGTVMEKDNPEHKKIRSVTKTLTYGVLYGSGAAKAGSIIGANSKRGEKLISSFIHNTPGLLDLKLKIHKFSKRGSVPALDGRRVWIRKEHAALNSLLQSAGAIIAKQWLVEATKSLREHQIDAKLIAFVHDETQWEVAEHQAEQAKVLIEQAAAKAGNILGFRCPVDAEGKIGNNWKECH